MFFFHASKNFFQLVISAVQVRIYFVYVLLSSRSLVFYLFLAGFTRAAETINQKQKSIMLYFFANFAQKYVKKMKAMKNERSEMEHKLVTIR